MKKISALASLQIALIGVIWIGFVAACQLPKDNAPVTLGEGTPKTGTFGEKADGSTTNPDSNADSSMNGDGNPFATSDGNETDAYGGSGGSGGSGGEGGSGGSGGNNGDGEEGRMVGMTAAHNAVRAQTDGGSGGPIPPLDWSIDLASIAQDYAENLAVNGCQMIHSNNGYGENIAWFSGQSATVKQVVELWASEEKCYTYGHFMQDDKCSASCSACGHYTQVVWRSTVEVGCGVAVCSESPHEEIWVCNYNPAGNFIGQYPY